MSIIGCHILFYGLFTDYSYRYLIFYNKDDIIIKNHRKEKQNEKQSYISNLCGGNAFLRL